MNATLESMMANFNSYKASKTVKTAKKAPKTETRRERFLASLDEGQRARLVELEIKRSEELLARIIAIDTRIGEMA